ncbi:MAG: glycosyltransferase [Leptolyngbya sp.]|nr:glycosyltransferase [Candidatus Melainabacteria bacterium]
MRICLIISQSQPTPSTSDEVAFFKELAPALVGAGHDVTLLTDAVRDFQTQGLKVLPVKASESLKNLRLAQTVLPKAHGFAYKQLGFWNTFVSLNSVQAFEVVHAPASQAGALLAAVGREIPSVLTVHPQFSIDKSTSAAFDENFETLVSDYVFNCADVICFASSEMRNAFAAQLADIDRISALDENPGQSSHAQIIACYEKAVSDFILVRKPKLYRHGAQRLVKSAEDMIMLFDRMLYDLLFRVSYRFRLKHWISMLVSRPEIFARKVRQSFGLRS